MSPNEATRLTGEILEAGRGGPRLRSTGGMNCKRCSKEGPVWRRQVLVSRLGFGGESAQLGRRADGRAY